MASIASVRIVLIASVGRSVVIGERKLAWWYDAELAEGRPPHRGRNQGLESLEAIVPVLDHALETLAGPHEHEEASA